MMKRFPFLGKIILSFLFVATYLICCIPHSLAQNYTFSDAFEANLSESWLTIDLHNPPEIELFGSRSVASFAESSSKDYDYLGFSYTDSPLKSVTFDIYYSSSGNVDIQQGAGFMLTDRVPIISERPPNDFDYYSVGIWPLADDSFYVLSPLCDYSTQCNLPIYDRALFKILPDQWNNISVNYTNDSVLVSLNGHDIALPLSSTIYSPNGFFFGNPEHTSEIQDLWPNFLIDNFLASFGNIADGLSFPHYSQLDSSWKDDEYDHASSWAAEGSREIEEWGCAVTSAAMILKYYDVNTPDSDETTTPKNLNAWLSDQPDGYIRNGLTNWLAIARYAHLSEVVGNSPTSLEYLRANYDASTTSTPTIAKNQVSHFIVLSGEDGDDWLVNDPIASESGKLAKVETLVTTNTFVPSNTDLSYMMFVVEPENNVELYDELGNQLTVESTVEKLEDGSEVKIVYYRKPATGKYRLAIVNNGIITDPLDIFTYDVEGKVEQITDELAGGEHKEWKIDYGKETSETTTITGLDISPPIVEITSPNTATLSGVVSVKGSVVDDNPDHYWLVVTNIQGVKVAGPGTVTRNDSFEDEVLMNWDTTLAPDGDYTIKLEARDSYDNKSNESIHWMNILVDNTGPAKVSGMRILDEKGNDLGCSGSTNNRRITIDWDDSTESDFDHYLYSIKDKEDFRILTTSSLTGDIRDLDGLYKYRVKAVDTTGNVGEASEWCEVTLDRLAPTQPGTPWTSPDPTNGLLQSWMWEESEDDESGVNGYYNRVYNALTGTYLSDWLWLGKVLNTSTDLTDGEWQLVVKSMDNAENESGTASSEVLLVDTMTPTLSSKTSLPDTWYNSVQTVTFQYSDLHLLSSYEDPWCEISTESSNSYCYVTPYICDTAGNCNNDKVFSDTIGLDLTKPTVSLSEWGSRLSGTANDDLSQVARVEIKLTKPGESEVVVTAVGTNDWTYTFEPAPVGSYIAKITSYDNAGNVSDEITKEYEINPSEPASESDSNEGVVAGVSTTASPTMLPSYIPMNSSTVSTNPSPSISPTPLTSSDPQVLGESDDVTEEENKINWWWLLLLLIPSWIYYRRKQS